MCHEHTAFAKLQKLRQNALNLLRVHYHIVPDTRQFLYFKRNRHFRIHERRKVIHNLTVTDFHCTNLYNPVFHRRKSRRLNIENDKILLEILSLIIGCNFMKIIYKICLYPIDYFKEILLIRVGFSRFLALILLGFPQILPHVVCVRKRLNHSVVRNSDCRMSPFIGALHDILRLGHTIHVTHLRMAM